jgi:hypothetical protein
MKEWLFGQFYHFNFLTIIVMITFVTSMSKANNMKLLKEQSSEFYNDIEEVKQEIWRASNGGRKS